MARSVIQRQFVGRLERLGAADHRSAVHRGPPPEQERVLAAQRMGPLVHRDDGTGDHEPGKVCRERLDSLVEIEVHGAVQMIWRQLCPEAVVLTDRREEMRPFVVGQHHGNGLLEVGPSRVGQGPDRARRIDDVGVAQQSERVEPLLSHQATNTRQTVLLHPACVGDLGDACRRDGRHQARRRHSSIPRKRLTLPLAIAADASGPTASTTEASDWLL